MTSADFRDCLTRRLRRANTQVTVQMVEQLETYFRLLAQWNGTVNLTSLSLEEPTDETFDRLLVEPMAAARYVSDAPIAWFDLGSGGGSPAIPLKITRPSLSLTMIESRARKAAFLREAIRTVGLLQTVVLTERFESVARAPGYTGIAELVTARAVKADDGLFNTARLMLKEDGRLLLFRAPQQLNVDPPGFACVSTLQLMDASPTNLSIYKREFHVEQRR